MPSFESIITYFTPIFSDPKSLFSGLGIFITTTVFFILKMIYNFLFKRKKEIKEISQSSTNKKFTQTSGDNCINNQAETLNLNKDSKNE